MVVETRMHIEKMARAAAPVVDGQPWESLSEERRALWLDAMAKAITAYHGGYHFASKIEAARRDEDRL